MWEYMPELNQARDLASACSLKDKIYVFSGDNLDYQLRNSIEKLNNPFLTMGEAFWQLIQLPVKIFSLRQNPVVVPLNAN